MFSSVSFMSMMPSPTDFSVSTKEDGAFRDAFFSSSFFADEEEVFVVVVVLSGKTPTSFEEELEVGNETLALSFKRISSCNNSYSSTLTSTVLLPPFFLLKLLIVEDALFSSLSFVFAFFVPCGVPPNCKFASNKNV